ncbi:hypothetical protein [Pseudonocardia acidicola]|uniref:Secreted protein n=1 Tax=Pseudonocardia acidicola TaxID=2724939 RepID=A0ABX1SJ26_9PSEU|nr:hypothetical protein [Pseudonocardia acidicola]NMI01591.1 hypothetical protein [Pseudonocardia acidicola]
MITVILVGFTTLVAIAATVGVVDAASAPKRRLTATERRHEWERRQHLHGRPRGGNSWADEDD